MDFCQEQKVKLDKSKSMTEPSSIGFLENMSTIEELINNFALICEKYPLFIKNLSPIFITIYTTALEVQEMNPIHFEEEKPFPLRNITWRHLVNYSFFFETLFQIINSICVKLLKISSSYCGEDLTLAVTVTRIKNLKAISQYVVNVSKYFGKLRKQLEEKKSKSKSEVIRSFLLIFVRLA